MQEIEATGHNDIKSVLNRRMSCFLSFMSPRPYRHIRHMCTKGRNMEESSLGNKGELGEGREGCGDLQSKCIISSYGEGRV